MASPAMPSSPATVMSRATPKSPARREKTSSAPRISASPVRTRAYDAQPPAPNTARNGSTRPLESTQRSRWASSAWRHSRAIPARPSATGQKNVAVPNSAPSSSISPTAIAPRATTGPRSVSRRTRPGRFPARVALSRPGASRSNWVSDGSTSQRAPYSTTPSPPSMVATTNPTRTHSTGNPRCRASPDATPPMIGCWLSR